ncbi:MAG TPA: alpha-L-arabinofuranosidase C-terminal domain-containing protein, partial [Chitinophagaceae bacterium]|nr:alpha-L-arabinofuranosidase C-terminal domain-containing protein [Chitinophagaceae bacterium]
LTDKEKMILTPTYHVMEMYNVHQDATLIPVSLNGINYVQGTDSLPALSVSASKDKSGLVHVSLVNIDPVKEAAISLDMDGTAFKQITGRILASAHLQDYNSFENPDKIKPVSFNGASLKGNTLQVKLPPASVIVLELK